MQKRGENMKDENLNALETLSKTAYRSGMLPIFLGILIGFIGIINKSTQDILTGLFVFVVGYALIKIAKKISQVVNDEKA